MNNRNQPKNLRRDLETIVYDDIDSCPYIKGNASRTPMRYQHRRLSSEEMDRSFSSGDRRVGFMLYHPECPNCSACEPIRVPVGSHKATKSMRRILRKNSDLYVELGIPKCDEQRLNLYNRHKFERNLSANEREMTAVSYEGWLINSCQETKEFRYHLNGELIGISIVDIGAYDMSSVYFYFNPDYSSRCLGTFSALFEMDWMRKREMRYYYLGLYVEQCQHLSYKSRYYPHERLIQGDWKRFETSKTTPEQARQIK
jgi:leucyl-tRNA---protein transferase